MDKAALSDDRLELSPPFPLGVLKRSNEPSARHKSFWDDTMDFDFLSYGRYSKGTLRVHTLFQGDILMVKDKYDILPCDYDAGIYVLRKYRQSYINRPIPYKPVK